MSPADMPGAVSCAGLLRAMIAVPTGSSVVAPVNADKTRLNASDDAAACMPSSVTLTVFAVSPGANLRLPHVAT
ncbi:MAG: hypothetical protein AW07_01356 [Candidatus Accumulibacter sp. SK-11]|nr:MAG: hypothetical protein AW07_01356 [Candidatus Accumulibacter sp. SK-11]